MSKLADLKKELRDLRKKHCPPTTKMKKADVEKEVERLRGMEKHTEYQAPPAKARVKKAKVEKKEMAVQASMDSEEEEERREAMAKRMAEVRARRKIAGAVAKAVEAKKEKKETEEKVESMKKKVASKKIAGAVKKAVETKKGKAKAVAEEAVKAVEKKKAKKEAEAMGAEDVDVGKPKKRKLRREGGEVIKKVNVIEEKVEEKVEEKPARKKKQVKREEKIDFEKVKYFKAPLAEYMIPDSAHKVNGLPPLKLWEKQEVDGKTNMVEVLTEQNKIPMHPVVVKDVHKMFSKTFKDGKEKLEFNGMYNKGEYQVFKPFTRNIHPEDMDKETKQDLKEQYEDRIMNLKNQLEDVESAPIVAQSDIRVKNEKINKAVKQLEKKIREIK